MWWCATACPKRKSSADRTGIGILFRSTLLMWRPMVWKRWGVRTQCYSLAVLRGLLNVEGYDVERIQRVEYDWDTERDIKIPKAARPFDCSPSCGDETRRSR